MSVLLEDGFIRATVHKDARGLGLLRVYLSANRGGGYPRYGRVTTEGGVTYIVNRDQGAAPREATLILSQEEASALSTALAIHLHGAEHVKSIKAMQTTLETAQRENIAMRKGKKAVETRVKDLEHELAELKEYRTRYQDLMAVVSAVNSGGRIVAPTALRDCE